MTTSTQNTPGALAGMLSQRRDAYGGEPWGELLKRSKVRKAPAGAGAGADADAVITTDIACLREGESAAYQSLWFYTCPSRDIIVSEAAVEWYLRFR